MPFSSTSSASLVHQRIAILAAATGLLLALSGVVGPAVAAGWDVCAHGCRHDQVGPALAASRAGDTIRVGPGVYTGGLTITTSVTLVGAGKNVTTIRGGGPVITIVRETPPVRVTPRMDTVGSVAAPNRPTGHPAARCA